MLGGCASGRHPNERTIANTTAQIAEIHMVDARNGWAWSSGLAGQRPLLHTTDGGTTWRDVTPRGFPHTEEGACFRDPRTAWVPIYDTRNTGDGLLRTTDGGKTWSLLNRTNSPIFNEASSCHFFSSNYGVGSTADGGLGSAYYTFFETHDSGRTWQTIPLTPPVRESVEQSNTVHLSNIGGDRIAFFPPSTTIIAHGDTADEQPKGSVRLSVTFDLGKTWRDLKLPLSGQYHDCLCAPFEPVFVDNKNIILPARVFKMGADGSYAPGVLIFYTSRDGGVTWVAKPGAVVRQDLADPNALSVVSPKCFFICSGTKIFVTHDGADTWQAIKANLAFGGTSHRDVLQMQFVDPVHGWIIAYEHAESPRNAYFCFYRTSDGGKTWTELPLKIVR
ncbi:MAG TPA: hypothetical protein VGI88_09010 [Verrucomicrobiae bacterium]